MAHFVETSIANEKPEKVYAYEQVTQFYRHLESRFGSSLVCGSEYLGDQFKSGDVIKGIRHENALAMSYGDASFDLMISNDVYEHVPDIDLALREAWRVLRSDGKLLFTVPFHATSVKTRQRASMANGTIDVLLPEEYHGNPVSSRGSLVFYDFGWDLLEMCTSAGFSSAYLLAYYDYFTGHVGNGIQSIFVAEK
jgi:SAM-dependent methyltransferase